MMFSRILAVSLLATSTTVYGASVDAGHGVVTITMEGTEHAEFSQTLTHLFVKDGLKECGDILISVGNTKEEAEPFLVSDITTKHAEGDTLSFEGTDGSTGSTFKVVIDQMTGKFSKVLKAVNKASLARNSYKFTRRQTGKTDPTETGGKRSGTRNAAATKEVHVPPKVKATVTVSDEIRPGIPARKSNWKGRQGSYFTLLEMPKLLLVGDKRGDGDGFKPDFMMEVSYSAPHKILTFRYTEYRAVNFVSIGTTKANAAA